MTVPVTLEVAINPLWPGEKLPHGDPRWPQHTASFKTERHTLESFAQRVAVDGCAFCPTMKGDYRCKENFISAQHLALDDDRGTPESSLVALAEELFIADHAAFLYETPSSTPDCPKSRVVFIVDRPFTQAEDYRVAQEALLWKFAGTDPSVKDSARFFYGRPGAQHVVLGHVLYRDLLQEEVVEPYLAHLSGNGYKAAEAIPAVIPQGERNNTLTSFAGTMRRRGMSQGAIEAALLAENTRRCDPPLGEDEVKGIAASVSHYPPAPQADGRQRPAAKENDVDLVGVLKDVVALVRQYMVLSAPQADAIALWTAHAHAFAAAETTPYLAARSAEKRSGKTRLLEVLENLVPEPLKTENISVAALVHSVDEGATLLLDEVDSVFGKGKPSETQEMLRGILDSGYRVGGSYVRMMGQGAAQQVRRFKTFSPKVLAGIGCLPGTIDDRCIILTLKRKAPHEKVKRFRSRDARQEAAPLCQALAQWATGALDTLRDARPAISAKLDDRAADSWEPLLAIADMAGGDWPQRARDVALELSAGEARQDDSIGVRLLADIRQAFTELKVETVFTADLLKHLNAMDESPWGGFGEKGMTGRDLSKRLKPYDIAPKQVRINERSLKGYEARWFDDAWSRYCPLPSGETSETSETLNLSPIWQGGETMPPNEGDVSPVSQIQPKYNVSPVSDETIGGGIRDQTCDPGEVVEWVG
jgi:hypothetical protein